MTVRLNPYLNFRDDAREAMEHYRTVFGGELTMSTFGEYGASEDPAEAGKIMHAQLETPSGLVLQGADTPSSMGYPDGSRVQVSVHGGPEDDAALRAVWAGLAEGGTEVMPLEVAPWGDAFGMVVDKFGISWMVNIGGAGAQG